MKRTILVTGAAVRIGREIALTFAKDGWNIIIHCNSSTEKAEALAKEIEENFDSTAKVVQANLDKDDHVERMIDEVKTCFGSLDAIVNNASSFYPTPIGDLTLKDWDQLIGSNLKGPLFLINGLIDLLKESKGVIINMTDMNVGRGLAKFSIYTAAKGGLLAATKVLARELAPDIRVNAVAPSMVRTESAEEFLGEKAERGFEVISKGQILQKTLEVDDIYGTVLYLAGDQSKFVTGQTIMVDGGSVLL